MVAEGVEEPPVDSPPPDAPAPVPADADADALDAKAVVPVVERVSCPPPGRWWMVTRGWDEY